MRHFRNDNPERRDLFNVKRQLTYFFKNLYEQHLSCTSVETVMLLHPL